MQTAANECILHMNEPPHMTMVPSTYIDVRTAGHSLDTCYLLSHDVEPVIVIHRPESLAKFSTFPSWHVGL